VPVTRTPCDSCPFRKKNHFQPNPEWMIPGDIQNWYDEANLRRCWDGVRSGEMMNCHSTDPEQSSRVPEGTKIWACSGAVGYVYAELNNAAVLGVDRHRRS